MHKFIVYICVFLPFLSAAEDSFPVELSVLTSKSSNFANELVFEQQKTQLGFGSKLVIPTSKPEISRPYGDLVFNHY